MSVQLNHTIVNVRDKHESARFVAEILGLGAPTSLYGFVIVKTGNGVTLDFLSTDEKIQIQHYAFLVSEAEFDVIFQRIVDRNITYWSDHMKNGRGQINRNDGGRGFYFAEPSGHMLEVITRPYGGG